jgi:type I restriction enzyme S subunit
MANSEWRTVKLEEVAREITVGFVGSMVQEYVTDGIPFLRSQNIEPFQINNKDLKFISPAFHKKIKKSSLAPGDVIIVRTGKPGACALVPEWLEDANCSDIVIVRCGPELDARFLVYYVNSVASHHVASHTVGAVQQHFNVGAARKLQLHLPLLEEQRRIAHILGTLDNKIELNRQLNATLEQLARALFQSWFVDFDPVRAKASGEAPASICRRLGLTPELLALFPAALEESALGEVPVGWKVSTIGAEMNTVLGGTPSRNKPEFWGGNIPWINSGKANEFRITEPSEFLTEAGLKGSAAKMLPLRTTVLAITGATLGQVSLTEIEASANQSIVGLIGNERVPNEFVYCLIKANIGRLLERKTGAAHQHVNKNDVNELKIILPSASAVNAFVEQVNPMFDLIKTQAFESNQLAALRDELLPKLLAGDVRLN